MGAGAVLTVLLFAISAGASTSSRAWASPAPRQTSPAPTTTLPPCPTNTATTVATLCVAPDSGQAYGPGDLCLVGGDPQSTTGSPGCTNGPDAPGAGLQNNLLGGQCGTANNDRYDIGYSTGGGKKYGLLGLVAGGPLGGLVGSAADAASSWNPTRIIPGFLTNLAFTAERWTVHAATCIIYWALQLKIADGLSTFAGNLAGDYQARIVGPLGLSSLALFLCIVWCAVKIIRGQMGRGVGELAVTFILMAIFSGVLAAPSTFLLGPDGFLGRAKSTAVEVAGITASIDPNAPAPPPPGSGSNAQQDAALMTGLQHAFVEVPWELLDWGEQLDNSHNPAPAGCVSAMHSIINNGPWGTSDTPRNTMAHAGCPDLAQFNANPSTDRLLAAVIAFWGSEIVIVLAMFIAFLLAVAQFALVGCVIAFPFVSFLALLPGGGRQWLWKWVTAILVAFSSVIATLVALSLMLVSVDAVVAAESGSALIITMAALDILAIAGIIALIKFRKGLRRTARKIGSSLDSMRVGGAGAGHRWLSPSQSAAAGFGVGSAATALYAMRRLSYLSRAVGAGGGGGKGPAKTPGVPRPALPADQQLLQLDMKDRHRLRSAHARRIAARLDSDARGVTPDPDRFWDDHVRPGDVANLRELHAARQAASGGRPGGGLAAFVGRRSGSGGPSEGGWENDGADVELLDGLGDWAGPPQPFPGSAEANGVAGGAAGDVGGGGPPVGSAGRERWVDSELVRLGVPEAVGYPAAEKEDHLRWAQRFGRDQRGGPQGDEATGEPLLAGEEPGGYERWLAANGGDRELTAADVDVAYEHWRANRGPQESAALRRRWRNGQDLAGAGGRSSAQWRALHGREFDELVADATRRGDSAEVERLSRTWQVAQRRQRLDELVIDALGRGDQAEAHRLRAAFAASEGGGPMMLDEFDSIPAERLAEMERRRRERRAQPGRRRASPPARRPSGPGGSSSQSDSAAVDAAAADVVARRGLPGDMDLLRRLHQERRNKRGGDS